MNETDKLGEEIFCLKYELDTLANVLLRNESERWLPGFLHERTEYSHLERYKLACQFTGGKKVLDVACGIGKGSNILAQAGNALYVNGFDIQPEAIRYAKWRNFAPNLEFSVVNAETMDITDAYDLAVSFETIEHLPNYRSFLTNVKKGLKSEGYLLISTPICPIAHDLSPANPYHVQEWGFNEFQKIIGEFFSLEKIFVQLYPPKPIVERKTITVRLIRKIKTKLGIVHTAKSIEDPLNPFSKIEEYLGQFPVHELGSYRVGYQIILAKK